jgi:hypothetical protein
MLSNFNQKMFINYVHKECFNSCVATGATLTKEEKNCYSQCKNKHASALGTFKEVLLQRRQWKGWQNFISVKEYSRTPEEIGTDFPTDPHERARIFAEREKEFERNAKRGLRQALGSEFEKEEEKLNIFDVYMKGRFTQGSKLQKEHEAKRRTDVYNEYKELNEKYGAQVAEMLKNKVNMKDWKDVPGEDWLPEEENTTTTTETEEVKEVGDAPAEEAGSSD